MGIGPTAPSGHNKLTGDLFDNEAANYDRLRPGYPSELFNTLENKAHLKPGSQLLEIGPGTGQATLPMTGRGYSVTAVEPGIQLANIARQKLAPCPDAEVVIGKFEDIEFPENSFDLVYGATSLHWVNPDVLFEKTHRVLKPGGYLGIIYNELVETAEDEAFFDVFEPIVLRYGVTSVLRAGTTPGNLPTGNSLVKRMEDLQPKFVVDRNLFNDVGFFITDPPVAFDYPTEDDYIDYLRTISHVSHLLEVDREAFLAEVRNIIEAQFDSKVTLHFSATLHLARRI